MLAVFAKLSSKLMDVVDIKDTKWRIVVKKVRDPNEEED